MRPVALRTRSALRLLAVVRSRGAREALVVPAAVAAAAAVALLEGTATLDLRAGAAVGARDEIGCFLPRKFSGNSDGSAQISSLRAIMGLDGMAHEALVLVLVISDKTIRAGRASIV